MAILPQAGRNRRPSIYSMRLLPLTILGRPANQWAICERTEQRPAGQWPSLSTLYAQNGGFEAACGHDGCPIWATSKATVPGTDLRTRFKYSKNEINGDQYGRYAAISFSLPIDSPEEAQFSCHQTQF